MPPFCLSSSSLACAFLQLSFHFPFRSTPKYPRGLLQFTFPSLSKMILLVLFSIIIILKIKLGDQMPESRSTNGGPSGKGQMEVLRHHYPFYSQVLWHRWSACFVTLSYLFRVLDASAGDADPVYRACTEHCKETGCVGDRCFPHCRSSLDGTSSDGLWYSKEHLKLQWKQGLCQSDCCYYCMLNREKDREALGYGPIKYHGKWPFKRIYGFQEPASVALSALNLGMHFHGWLSFFNLLKNKLPPKKDKKTDSGFTSLWHVYGLLSMNSWFWSAVFHGRGMDLTQKLNYSSVVALLGYSLILAVIRTFNLRTEAAQVMAAAPLLAFTITHIFFLNIYQFAYGWNMMVCVTMGISQLLLWAMWAGVTCHPSRWKLWMVVFGGALAMLLEVYDFPPYHGFLDAHALRHATTIPLTYIWWSFIKDDIEYCRSNLAKKKR